MSDEIGNDPGRFWRRMARCGGLMCLIATFLDQPILAIGNNLWQERISIFATGYASAIEYLSHFGSPISFGRSLMGTITLLFFPSQLLAGVTVAIIASRRTLDEEKSESSRAAAILLILVTTAISAVTALRSIPDPKGNETVFGIMLCGIFIFVFISGIALAQSRHCARSLHSVLLCLLAPLATASITWTAQFCAGWGWPVYLGFLGVIATDLGLFMWWRAVRRTHPSAKPRSEI